MHAPPMNVGVENGYGQLVIELGIVGLLLWILLAYAITRSAWRATKNLKGTVLVSNWVLRFSGTPFCWSSN